MICLRWNTCSYLISIIDLHLEYINRNCVSGGLVIKISASIIYWFKYFFLQLHQRTFLLGRKKMKCQRNVIFIIIWTILCLSYFGLNSLQGKHSFLKVFSSWNFTYVVLYKSYPLSSWLWQFNECHCICITSNLLLLIA